MSVRYSPVLAREGVRELITELGKWQNRANARNVLFYFHSAKSIHLIATGRERFRAMLIRPASEYMIGYTMQVPCEDPAFDNHAEVLRTDEGRLYFRENGHIIAVAEFLTKLLNLIAETNPSQGDAPLFAEDPNRMSAGSNPADAFVL